MQPSQAQITRTLPMQRHNDENAVSGNAVENITEAQPKQQTHTGENEHVHPGSTTWLEDDIPVCHSQHTLVNMKSAENISRQHHHQ